MAKYNFESTTIAEILDNEVTNKLFYDLVPEAKDYEDKLEIGRPLTISEAMPFIAMFAEELEITNFDERVEDFQAKLEAIE